MVQIMTRWRLSEAKQLRLSSSAIVCPFLIVYSKGLPSKAVYCKSRLLSTQVKNMIFSCRKDNLFSYSQTQIDNRPKIILYRAGNSLIWFPSESLGFCPKMSTWAICSKKWAIHSFPLSNASESLISLISNEQCEQIAHGRLFLMSYLSDSLTSLI